jgi:hypothetical protein
MDTPATTRKPGKKRIMVQLWETLAKAIDRDFKALNLKRDRYLNDLFGKEIEELAKEVGFRNSDAVRARLQEQKLPNRVPLTVELDETLVKRIDEVLNERNIPRDSFVNRVLFFLVAKQSMLERLGIEFERRGLPVSAKPLADALGYLYDPFFHIRSANNGLFYTLSCFHASSFGSKGPNLFALNVAIDEHTWELMNLDLLEDLGMAASIHEGGHAE